MKETLRVLIVDDNLDHAHLATEFLLAAGPFVTEVAEDVQRLWERLSHNTYDVVLLDYNLPDGNGLEALAEFAERGHRVPVIMVTGRGDERVAAQAIQRGAVDYLVKTGDYLLTLPALVEKAARTYQLKLLAQRSLEQIRYQALLLDNVHDAVVVWDMQGRLTFWNYAAEQLFGWRADERIGQQVERYYLHACQPSIVLPTPDQTALVDVERQGKHRNGRTVWLSSNVSLLRDGSNQPQGYMDVSRDISGRKRLEAQIQAAQLQLAQAARLSAIGELASGVAHQISNPLTTIIAEAQLLLRSLAPNHPARESAEAMEQAGWKAQQSVQRLLDFSRPAAATLEALNVNDTVTHARELIGAYIEAMGATLHLELAAALPPVHGNARQLEDLWVNLLLLARDGVNRAAAHANGATHTIRLTTGLSESGQVQVTVNDDGELIPPELLESIFEPDYVRPVAGRGTGLELSICREIVRQHEGQIFADSAPQRGNTFTVLLPVTPGQSHGAEAVA